MVDLKPGDCISCRVNQYIIVSPYHHPYDDVVTFEIIALDNRGYYLYIPSHIMIKGSAVLDRVLCRQLSINKRFLGEQFIYILANLVDQVKYVMDGISCCKCQDFFYMAEPNQDDGTLLCWSCRANPYR